MVSKKLVGGVGECLMVFELVLNIYIYLFLEWLEIRV